MARVAVIIPCKNHGRYLNRCVTSAWDADEIIVINDHSTDDTARIAAELTRHYPHVTALDNPGVGVVAARNAGIQAASSDLIVPLDADDQFASNGLYLLTQAWKPGTWIYSDYYLTTASGVTERKHAPPPGVLHRKNVTHATVCFARADFQCVGGYDPDFEICCEDWALTIALTERGIVPKYLPEATYIRAAGGRSRACLRHAKTIRQLLATKYGSRYG